MRVALVAIIIAVLMLPASFLQSIETSEVESTMIIEEASINHEVFITPPLDWWTEQQEVRALVLTDDLPLLHSWQSSLDLLPEQDGLNGHLVPTNPESLQGAVHHRSMEMPGHLVAKLVDVPGVRAVSTELPQAEPADMEARPGTFKAVEIHGATQAWNLNVTGKGVKVAVVDSGVDFAHPDLNGTQARDENVSSPWFGWPIAHDPRSLNDWLEDGETYPGETNSWFSDTSTTDGDTDSDSLLDSSGYNVFGISSVSGIYRTGDHPDGNLQSRVGGDVPILLVDSTVAGVYDTVYVDMDGDDSFADEKAMVKGDETTGLDLDGDGLWDRSGGMIYFIADGSTSLQYAPTLAARQGLADRIPGNGDLVAFMLNEASGPAGNHGTLCASAVSAQGIVASGKVQGMAPNATVIGVGNYYNGGSTLDAWRFVAEGSDGLVDTGDEAQIGSFSFGYSGVIDAGSDFSSLYLDWMTRVHSPRTSYMVAMGNGGHGYGTVTSPSGSPGVFSVGASTSKTGQSAGDTWGDIAMWSDRGPNSQGRMDPDIVAIGWSATGDKTLNEVTDANSAYGTWGGTSLATPVAAGLMALVMQAYHDEHGTYPDSQEIRDLVMSTALDVAHDPLTQGAGWFDAARAVQTIQGANDTWWVEPAVLMPGQNDGAHRVANANWALPGDSFQHRIRLNNPQDVNQRLNLTPERYAPTSHQNFTWISNEGMGWDGYQSSRPDFVMPVLIDGDANNTSIDSSATLVRVRAAINPLGFDGNQNRQSENRVYLYAYRWNDTNGDGMYWEDSNSDSFVQSGEWQEDEVSVMAASYFTGPQNEVRISDPWSEEGDGILIGLFREEVRTGYIDPLQVQVDMTGFSKVIDPWISVPTSTSVGSQDHRNRSLIVNIPVDATPGLHMSGVRIDDGRGRDWLLPIIITVAAQGPYDWVPRPVDNNMSNQTLYSETWMQGAQRWGWRAESGDWKAVAVDWPANMSDGTIIIDVDWPDNGHTDIDAFWLSETSHPFANDDPDAYGSKGMHIETGSDVEHTGSGIWMRETTTGEDREVLTAEASPGHKILLLHSTMHGVLTNDNPVNISIGYVTALAGNTSFAVNNWSRGDFNETLTIGSTSDLGVDDIVAFGWSEDEYFANESVGQDDPGSVSSASYTREIELDSVESLRVAVDTLDSRDDIDLYLYRDKNANGVIDWSSEREDSSGSGSSSELCSLKNPADGTWWVVVHGYAVSGNNTSFWLEIDIVGGDSISVFNHSELNSTQINASWSGGSSALGGEVPERVWELNLSIERPVSSGLFNGHVALELENDAHLLVPMTYQLLEGPTLISFTTPADGSHHNSSVNISAHLLDDGAGFNLSNITLHNITNLSSIEGIAVNGSSIAETDLNSSILAEELWLNFSLPENESEQSFAIEVMDYAGLYTMESLTLTYDATPPMLEVPDYTPGQWLTNQTTWNLTFVSESELDAWVESTPVQGDGGFYNMTLDLEQEGLNRFNLTIRDRAGNWANQLVIIERDTVEPSLFISSDAALGVVNTSTVEFDYQVEVGARLWIQGEEVLNPSNLLWNSHSVNTDEGDFVVELVAQDDAGNWNSANLSFRVDTLYPVVQWLEPEVNATLSNHAVPLAWYVNEDVSVELSVEGEWRTLPASVEGRNAWLVTLEKLEDHQFCLMVIDEGRNSVVECIDVNLPTSLYTPILSAPWDGEWVNTSQVEARLYVGPGQVWMVNTAPPLMGVGNGSTLNISIPLEEGENLFTLSVDGLTIEESWDLVVYSDTVSPTISIMSPGDRIAFTADAIPDRYPPFMVNGISESNMSIRCLVDQTGTWSETTSVEDGTWEMGLIPWSDWRDLDLDGRVMSISCTATDLAGNTATDFAETTIDTTPPVVTLEFIGDLEGLFLYHDVVSSDGISQLNMTLLHDGVVVSSYTDLPSQGQIALDVSEGTWNATLKVEDNAGHLTTVSIEIVLASDEKVLTDVLEAVGGPLQAGIGLLILAVILVFIFRPRKGEDEILGVPMDPELFQDSQEPLQPVESLINVSAPATVMAPSQSDSLAEAVGDLFDD